jgi:phage-related protein
MMLALYKAEETEFSGLGLGILENVRNDEVREVLNGQFELQLQYPVTGRLMDQIQPDAYITARPNPLSDPQPFRIYRIRKGLGGWVTVYARHISYRMASIVNTWMESPDLQEALVSLQRNAVGSCPFRFSTDMENFARFYPMPYPQCIRDRLLFLRDVQPFDFEFDGYNVRLLAHRGQDRDVWIRYGVNMKDMQFDHQLGERYNGIYGYRLSDGGLCIEEAMAMSPDYVEGQEKRLLLKDYTDASEVQTLQEHVEEDVRFYDIGADDSERILTVDFEQLSRTEEYRDMDLPDDIGMGDTVHVFYAALGLPVNLRAVEIRYQPSQRRYKSVTLGSTRKDILGTILAK